MSTWAVVGIIVVVLAVIVSNIMLLKYSANFKMPKTYREPEKPAKTASQAAPESSDQTPSTSDDKHKP